jgi:hypothetical protein
LKCPVFTTESAEETETEEEKQGWDLQADSSPDPALARAFTMARLPIVVAALDPSHLPSSLSSLCALCASVVWN